MQNAEDGFISDVYGSVNRIIRRSHKGQPQVIVLTPTIGSEYLFKAIESVLRQDFQDIIHLLIIDGIQFEEKTRQIISRIKDTRCRILTLPFNTGKNGINGHRIYATLPLLVNSNYIFFLDEDNWWDNNHVSSLIRLMKITNVDWAYSMRKIYTHDAFYVADDNCESIGAHTPFSGLRNGWPSYVDTNCYAFRRNTIAQSAHFWYHPLRADRHFFHKLIELFPNYISSKKYTVNYRLKKDGPVSPDYILEGNKYMLEKYNLTLPWL